MSDQATSTTVTGSFEMPYPSPPKERELLRSIASSLDSIAWLLLFLCLINIGTCVANRTIKIEVKDAAPTEAPR